MSPGAQVFPVRKTERKKLALCLDNADYEASLIAGKMYRVIPDPRAEKDDLIRVVDEDGEDYLYHKSMFVFVDLPRPVQKKLLAHVH